MKKYYSYSIFLSRVVFFAILSGIFLPLKFLYATEPNQSKYTSTLKKSENISKDVKKTKIVIAKKNNLGKIGSMKQINKLSNISDINNKDEQV